MCGLPNRVKNQEFVDYVHQFDFLLFVETKTDKQDHQFIEEIFKELGYRISIYSRKYLSYQRSGGIAVAIKESFVDHIHVFSKC